MCFQVKLLYITFSFRSALWSRWQIYSPSPWCWASLLKSRKRALRGTKERKRVRVYSKYKSFLRVSLDWLKVCGLSQIWKYWGLSKIRLLPSREMLCGGFTRWFLPSAKSALKTTFTGECSVSYAFTLTSLCHFNSFFFTAFIKSSSLSSLRRTISGTTGLQRVTESESPSNIYLFFISVSGSKAFSASVSSSASAPRFLCWRTRWCASWSSDSLGICPWARRMPWSWRITWSREPPESTLTVRSDPL